MDSNSDLLLTLGIVLMVLSIPALLAAWAESRAPRAGAIMVIVALAMIVTALVGKPGGYAFNDIPGVMIAVIAGFFN